MRARNPQQETWKPSLLLLSLAGGRDEPPSPARWGVQPYHVTIWELWLEREEWKLKVYITARFFVVSERYLVKERTHCLDTRVGGVGGRCHLLASPSWCLLHHPLENRGGTASFLEKSPQCQIFLILTKLMWFSCDYSGVASPPPPQGSTSSPTLPASGSFPHFIFTGFHYQVENQAVTCLLAWWHGCKINRSLAPLWTSHPSARAVLCARIVRAAAGLAVLKFSPTCIYSSS